MRETKATYIRLNPRSRLSTSKTGYVICGIPGFVPSAGSIYTNEKGVAVSCSFFQKTVINFLRLASLCCEFHADTYDTC